MQQQLTGACAVLCRSWNKFLPCAGLQGADGLRGLRSSERRFGQMNVSQWSLFSSGLPSAHMLIVRMCIEAADVRIRLHSSRGLSALPTTPVSWLLLHQKVTHKKRLHGFFFLGQKSNCGGRRWEEQWEGLTEEFFFSCLLFNSDLFPFIITSPWRRDPRPRPA